MERALKKLEAKGATLVRTDHITGVTDILIQNVGVREIWGLANGMDLRVKPKPFPLNTIANPNVKLVLIGTNIWGLGFFPTVQYAVLFYYYNFIPNGVEVYRNAYRAYFSDNNLDAVIYPTTIQPVSSIKDMLKTADMYPTGEIFVSKNGVLVSEGAALSENIRLSPLLGHPSLSMPAGMTKETDLPVGILIEGKVTEMVDGQLVRDDLNVLEIGSAIEYILRTKKPDLNKLDQYDDNGNLIDKDNSESSDNSDS